ncbi:hypothetical protein Pelo_1879 [Pelomyxa schiedti]|nr:hypothetical protein Pelo_1879 [Pelomyxa schiedti]
MCSYCSIDCILTFPKTPLHVACRTGHPEAVRILLEHPNIDVSIKNAKGQTALDLCKDDECRQHMLKKKQ